MKMTMFTAAILVFVSHASFARTGGTGGTTGGNPKAIAATPFNKDPERAAKLKEAVAILRERLPKNCFPKDYNNTVLAEMDRLLESGRVFYFPEHVLLGSDRYAGDY